MRNIADRDRRFSIVLPLLAAAAGLVLPLPSGAAEPADNGMTVLHLTQMAERAIHRDRLRAQLRVEATGSDAKRVQADINKTMSAALDHAKSATGIKVETSGYSVYEERLTDNSSRWHGNQGLTLVGGDFAAVLALAGELQGQGLGMSGLSFELAPETARAAQDDLTSEALTQLRQRSERIANDLQLKLVRLRDVTVGNATGEQPPMPRMRAVAMSDKAVAPPPAAEAGDATVQVTVDADILLAPPGAKSP
jgi:predicted secreted protein